MFLSQNRFLPESLLVLFGSFWLFLPLGASGDQSVSLGRLWGGFGETLGGFWETLGGFGEALGRKKRRREGKNMEVAHLNFVTLCKLICMFHCMAAA